MGGDSDRNSGVTDKGFKKSTGDHSEDSGSDISPFEGKDQHGWAPDVGQSSEANKQAGDRAFEGRDTQDASRNPDGGTERPMKAAEKVGESISTPGNERALGDDEPGREDTEGGDIRPRGTSSERDATSVGADRSEPQEDAPNMPPGDQGG